MAGVKGRSGKKLDSHWRDAIWRAVNETDGNEKRLHKLARQLVANGLSGDVSALREIGDRLDGKPRQETDVTINDNRDPTTLSDAELAAIAASDGSGADAETAGDSGSVH
jgi:hypothetical protein